MKVLLVGGSGRVGTMVTPYLRRHHDLRVLDLVPPRHEDLDYVAGSVLDADTVRRLAGQHRRGLPIVFVTGYQDYLRHVPSDSVVLMKPVADEELLSAIKTALETS